MKDITKLNIKFLSLYFFHCIKNAITLMCINFFLVAFNAAFQSSKIYLYIGSVFGAIFVLNVLNKDINDLKAKYKVELDKLSTKYKEKDNV